MYQPLLGSALAKLLGSRMARSQDFRKELFGRDFYHTELTRKYDEDLYKCFLLAKHGERDSERTKTSTQGLCWHRQGVVYSGIKFVLACSNVALYDTATIVRPSTVFCFNVWCHRKDSIRTAYYKLYSSGSRVLRFYFYDCQYTRNYPVLGDDSTDSRFDYNFHKAVTNLEKDDIDVIQDVLYHTGVLVSLYIVQLTRYVLDGE